MEKKYIKVENVLLTRKPFTNNDDEWYVSNDGANSIILVIADKRR